MSDEIQSATFGSEPPYHIATGRISYWSKMLLVCKPFYLVSAALLLYGMYRVSLDPVFLSTEVKQLAFNFTSPQCDEVLLVITTIVLAKRGIWYDSTLLLVLKQLLVLVPFILISQAALIDNRRLWILGAAVALIALARSAAARR